MRSAFARQMALISALILLTLALTGGAYRLAMGSYLEAQQRRTLTANAETIAELCGHSGPVDEPENIRSFLLSVSLTSRISGADAVICDTAGTILVCSEQFPCAHIGETADADFLAKVLRDGETYVRTTLPELYPETRNYEAKLLTSRSGLTLGVVIVSAPVAEITQAMGGTFRLFMLSALASLLIALAITYFVSRRENKPIHAFSQTVRRFGHGDYSARIAPDSAETAELAELAAAFNAMADTLQRSEQQRQEFIANISHELKTPMTTIAGYMDGMLDGTIPPKDHPRYMKTVADEVRRLNRLVRSMLELSRMQAEQLDENKKTRFDVCEATAKVLLSFERQAEEKHLNVQVALPETPVYVRAYADAITQVLYNLTENAVKFCDDGGELTVSVQRNGEKAFVAVSNSGKGIPPEELPRIFDRFHKLDKSRSKDVSGVGLGLYIVKTIIGKHGEEIWVESRDGLTTFTFTLPMAE